MSSKGLFMTTAALAAAAAVVPPAATGFVIPTTTSPMVTAKSMKRTTSSTCTTQGVTCLNMSSQDEVAKLREAAAKAREEAERLAKELGRTELAGTATASATTAAPKSLSLEDVATLCADVPFEGGDASSQSSKLDSLVESGDFRLWKSGLKSTSNLRTYPVSTKFLESRTAGKITASTLGLTGDNPDVSLDDFKYATLGVTLGCSILGVGALAVLPENVGATVCYLLAVIPVLFLGVGSTAPGAIASVLANIKGTADDNDQRTERICRHEAGHFLCGYLCGLPVKQYAIMSDSGVPTVEFHPSTVGPATGRSFSSEEIAALSVVAMSGSVSEILGAGTARGGETDLIELEAFYRRSEDFIGAEKQQDLTRWGALTAYQLLSTNRAQLERLVSAFKEQKSVSECVAILECSK